MALKNEGLNIAPQKNHRYFCSPEINSVRLRAGAGQVDRLWKKKNVPRRKPKKQGKK